MPPQGRIRHKSLAELLPNIHRWNRNHYHIVLDANVNPESDGTAAGIPVNEQSGVSNHRTFRICHLPAD